MLLFTFSNATPFIALAALFVSIYNLIEAKKQGHIKIEERESVLSLAVDKLHDLYLIVKEIKNIDYNNITIERFSDDLVLINRMLTDYENEKDLISKASSAIPDNLREIKLVVRLLEENFRGNKMDDLNENIEEEKIYNYSMLFFYLALFFYPIEIRNSQITYINDSSPYTYFMGLREKFKNYIDSLHNERWKALMEEGIELFEKFKKNYS